MRGSQSNTNKQQSNECTDFEDDSDSDQQAEQGGAEAEAKGSKGEDNSQKKQKKKRRSKKDKDWEQWNWTLGNINAGDMRKRTSFNLQPQYVKPGTGAWKYIILACGR